MDNIKIKQTAIHIKHFKDCLGQTTTSASGLVVMLGINHVYPVWTKALKLSISAHTKATTSTVSTPFAVAREESWQTALSHLELKDIGMTVMD